MKTKKWISKLGALILTAVMVITAMPAMDVTAAEPIDYYITIAGKRVTSDYLSNATEGWKYTPATDTEIAKLTLTNAQITYDSGVTMELSSQRSLEIILEGDNYVTATEEAAILAADVNITGNGSLTVLSESGYYAMSAGVCVGENATLVVKTEKVDNSLNTSVGLRSYLLTVKSGGVFIAQGKPCAIGVKNGKITIGEGNVVVGGESSDKVTELSKRAELTEFMGGWESDFEGYVNEDGTFAEYIHIGPEYAVEVIGGTASDAMGSNVVKSVSGGKVTVTADAAPAGKVFDKWVVESASVTMEDATKTTTTFVMPRGNVKLTAKFLEEKKEEENVQSASNKIMTGMTETVGKAVYKVTASDSETKSYTVSYMKNTNKKSAVVTVPNTVKIGDNVYKVTSIEKEAFKNNKKLKKVTIGKNVKKIGARAFYGCKKLKSIVVKSKILKSVGKNALKGVNKKCKIKVPKAKLKKYKKLFKNKGQKKTVKVVK